jgi:hypothetical protein
MGQPQLKRSDRARPWRLRGVCFRRAFGRPDYRGPSGTASRVPLVTLSGLSVVVAHHVPTICALDH